MDVAMQLFTKVQVIQKDLKEMNTAVKPAGETVGGGADGEEGDQAPNHASQKDIVSVTESLEKLNNEL